MKTWSVTSDKVAPSAPLTADHWTDTTSLTLAGNTGRALAGFPLTAVCSRCPACSLRLTVNSPLVAPWDVPCDTPNITATAPIRCKWRIASHYNKSQRAGKVGRLEIPEFKAM